MKGLDIYISWEIVAVFLLIVFTLAVVQRYYDGQPFDIIEQCYRQQQVPYPVPQYSAPVLLPQSMQKAQPPIGPINPQPVIHRQPVLHSPVNQDYPGIHGDSVIYAYLLYTYITIYFVFFEYSFEHQNSG